MSYQEQSEYTPANGQTVISPPIVLHIYHMDKVPLIQLMTALFQQP